MPADDLQTGLLGQKKLCVEAKDNMFTYYYKEVPAKPSWHALMLYRVSLFTIMFTRMIAIGGMMIYSEKDLFRNEHYIFSDFFNEVPATVWMSLIAWSVIADADMNLVTRGVSTAEKLQKFFFPQENSVTEQSEQEREKLLASSLYLRVGKNCVVFSLVMSAVAASLVSFLGAVTLEQYVMSSPTWFLMAAAIWIAATNLITNLCFRFDTTVNNFLSFATGEFEYPLLTTITAIIGSVAFMGTCYYGTNNSLRKFLSLLKVYAGNPDSGAGLIARYEHWINGVNDATLPFSEIAFIFSQCMMMFPRKKEKLPRVGVKISLPQLVAFVADVQAHPNYQELRYYDYDYWWPKLLQILCLTSMPVLVPGATLGNVLPTLNSCNGLLVHVFFGENQSFSQSQKIGIGMGSALLTAVFAQIFWSFNVVGWFNHVEAFWAKEMMKMTYRVLRLTDHEFIEKLNEFLNDQPAEQNPSLWDKVRGFWQSRVNPSAYPVQTEYNALPQAPQNDP